MSLTGLSDGPPRLAPRGVPVAVEGAFRALTALAGPGALESLDAHALLSERAAHFGGQRRGRTSPGGSCRLLPSRDGWIAVNLARPDDLGLLAAWFEDETAPIEGDLENAWRFLSKQVVARSSCELVDRGRLLGLPVTSALPTAGASAGDVGWRREVP